MTEEELQALIDKWTKRQPEFVPYVYHTEVEELFADFMMVAKALQRHQNARYIGSSGEYYERQRKALRLFFAPPYDRLIIKDRWEQLPENEKQEFLFLEGCGLIWKTDLHYDPTQAIWAYMPTETGYREYRQLQEKDKTDGVA